MKFLHSPNYAYIWVVGRKSHVQCFFRVRLGLRHFDGILWLNQQCLLPWVWHWYLVTLWCWSQTGKPLQRGGHAFFLPRVLLRCWSIRGALWHWKPAQIGRNKHDLALMRFEAHELSSLLCAIECLCTPFPPTLCRVLQPSCLPWVSWLLVDLGKFSVHVLSISVAG